MPYHLAILHKVCPCGEGGQRSRARSELCKDSGGGGPTFYGGGADTPLLRSERS